MKRKDTIARIIRIVSVPPVMVSTLLIVLNICRPDIFHRTNDVILPLFMLGIVPVLAYLFYFLIKFCRKDIMGRLTNLKLSG